MYFLFGYGASNFPFYEIFSIKEEFLLQILTEI